MKKPDLSLGGAEHQEIPESLGSSPRDPTFNERVQAQRTFRIRLKLHAKLRKLDQELNGFDLLRNLKLLHTLTHRAGNYLMKRDLKRKIIRYALKRRSNDKFIAFKKGLAFHYRTIYGTDSRKPHCE